MNASNVCCGKISGVSFICENYILRAVFEQAVQNVLALKQALWKRIKGTSLRDESVCIGCP